MALLSKRFLPAFTRLWYLYVGRANAPTEVACDQSWIRNSPRAFIPCKTIFQTLPRPLAGCGWPLDKVEALIKDDPEILRLWRTATTAPKHLHHPDDTYNVSIKPVHG
jgi:hypothetical protein